MNVSFADHVGPSRRTVLTCRCEPRLGPRHIDDAARDRMTQQLLEAVAADLKKTQEHAMPHDKNGIEIVAGDGVIFTDWNNRTGVGTVAKVHPGADGCNVEVVVPIFGGTMNSTVDADRCEVLTRDGQRLG